MGELPVFPSVPADTDLYPPEEQASVVLQTFTKGAEVYATCRTSRDTLIDWISNSDQ